MVKILGCVLVLASSVLLGIYYSFRDGYRMANLSEIRKALIILKSEITFSATLPEALLSISDRLEAGVSGFFLLAGTRLTEKPSEESAVIWRECLKEGLAHSYLVNEDIECLERLGETLGGLGKTAQEDGVDMAIMYIDSKVDELRGSEAKNKKLYRSVGAAGGLLITILMI
ncbi:MAG: stage III sporulation protein AB [Clostridiales bacterium]|nr:stage III sporulation protein AB [Clostridiales bacterium]